MKYEDIPRDPETKGILVEQVEFPIRYTLLAPIEVAGVETSEIDIQEPTVADLKTARKADDNVDRSVRLLCCVSPLAEGDAQRMGTRDFNRLSEALGSFL